MKLLACDIPTGGYIVDASLALKVLQTIGTTNMEPAFAPEQITYTAWAGHNVPKITLKAVPNEAVQTNLRYQNGAWKQFKNVVEELPLTYGYNHFLIEVVKRTAERVYKLIVVRWAGACCFLLNCLTRVHAVFCDV